jgi:hypothetical protein
LSHDLFSTGDQSSKLQLKSVQLSLVNLAAKLDLFLQNLFFEF